VRLLLIALGGALGTSLRYGVGKLSAEQAAGAGWFPSGTFAVNLLGSLLLGLLFVLGEGRSLLGVDLRLVLGTGLMGGFTTYSSFNLETLRLLEAGQTGRALLYVAITLGSCLVGGALGLALGRQLQP